MTCVAILGTGSIGTRHLKCLRQIDGAKPIAVPRRQERIGQLQKAGFATAVDLGDAVRQGARLCIVATDTIRHAEDSLNAMELGLDVLIEKPLAPHADEAKRVYEVAIQSNRRIFVGCVLRFSESLNQFRDLLERVGPLHSVRIESQSYLPDWRPGRPYRDSYSARELEGGALRDLIHEIDYAGWLFEWPSSLQARVRNLGRLGIASDETADLTWETSEACSVSLSLDYLSRPARRRIQAYGDKGTIEWNGMDGTVTLMLAGEDTREIRATQTRDEMFIQQVSAFINTCADMPDPRLATGEDGVKALAVCDAARQSSISKREEEVRYP